MSTYYIFWSLCHFLKRELCMIGVISNSSIFFSPSFWVFRTSSSRGWGPPRIFPSPRPGNHKQMLCSNCGMIYSLVGAIREAAKKRYFFSGHLRRTFFFKAFLSSFVYLFLPWCIFLLYCLNSILFYFYDQKPTFYIKY